MDSSFFASGLSGFLVSISNHIVMMHMLGSVLSLTSIGNRVESPIRNVVPARFRFVCQQNMAAIMPSQPFGHSLGQRPDVLIGAFLMEPMIQRTVKVIGVGVDLLRKLALQAWEHIVEFQCVSAQVHPS